MKNGLRKISENCLIGLLLIFVIPAKLSNIHAADQEKKYYKVKELQSPDLKKDGESFIDRTILFFFTLQELPGQKDNQQGFLSFKFLQEQKYERNRETKGRDLIANLPSQFPKNHDWLGKTISNIIFRNLSSLQFSSSSNRLLSYEFNSEISEKYLIDLQKYLKEKKKDIDPEKAASEQTRDFFASLYQSQDVKKQSAPPNAFLTAKISRWYPFLKGQSDLLYSEQFIGPKIFSTEQRKTIQDLAEGQLKEKDFIFLLDKLFQNDRLQVSKVKFQSLALAGFYHVDEDKDSSELASGRMVHVSLFLFDFVSAKISWKKKISFPVKGNWSKMYGVVDELKARLLAVKRSPVFVDTGTLPARIYIDGYYFGRAPQEILSLPAGWHHISLFYKDYKSVQQFILIKEGQKNSFRFTLNRHKNQYKLQLTGLIGAKAYLNGLYRCMLPCEIDNIPIAHHRLRVSKFGYQDYHQDFHITEKSNKFIKRQIFLEKNDVSSSQDSISRQTYTPYRGFNFFLNGNRYERISKYWLAFSVLSISSAIILDGLGLREIDRTITPEANQKNPYADYVNGLYILGAGSLVISGVYLYFSLDFDENLFSKSDMYKDQSASTTRFGGGNFFVPGKIIDYQMKIKITFRI